MRDNRGPIWLRLTLSYVGVALVAVFILAGITALLGEHDVNALVDQGRQNLIRSLVVDAASTYNTGRPGWSDVDLRPALDLAANTGADVAVVGNDGAVVAATFADPRHAPGTAQYPITVQDAKIGTLYVRFNGRGLVHSADNLRRSLFHAVVWSAGVAAVIALAAAILVARRLSVPLRTLTNTAGEMSQGNRSVRVGPLPGAPAELHTLATTFDRMADSIDDQERLRRDLVADVAHELRTPVAILQASTEALLDGVVEHTPAQTASLHEEVMRLAARVSDLQTLASAEAASLHLSLVRCDLAMVADVALDAMQTRAKASSIELRRQLRPAVVNGDPVRLHQVITNLLSNAIKFSAPGDAVSVTVDAHDGTAELVVADTGPGIPPDQLPHVFDRFWRGPGADPASGTGIGLAIVSELVAAHQGHIRIRSDVGTGTSVAVTMPALPTA